MKTISLRLGKVAIVDDADYPWLSLFNWSTCLTSSGWGVYAQVGKQQVYIHRLIMDAAAGYDVDHINHDRLDNRRSNLRLCTRSFNNGNTRHRKGCSSRFKGVAFDRACAGKPWKCYIQCQGPLKHIGRFATEEEAAHAYDVKAQELFGEFAYLNYPTG